MDHKKNFLSGMHDGIPIALGYPAGWLVCSTLTFIYYQKAKLSRNRLVDDEKVPAER